MGFAVFAYDKRGVGRSGGQYSGIGPGNRDSMFDLLAADAVAGVEFLKARREIDRSRIGLFGYSQAGWIAPLAAARSSDVRFVILVSGPAVTVGEENAYSDLAGADPGSRQGLPDAEIEREFAAFNGSHGYDPAPAIRSMSAPSLWLLGAKDRSIPVRRTVGNLERIRSETGRPISIHVFPEVDHSLRNPGTGEWTDYWPIVTSWLQKERVILLRGPDIPPRHGILPFEEEVAEHAAQMLDVRVVHKRRLRRTNLGDPRAIADLATPRRPFMVSPATHRATP